MHLIIGGAYQGKLDYAKTHFGVADRQVFTCREDAEIDLSKQCIRHIEEFVLYSVRNSINAVDYFAARRDDWRNAVLICGDISCGVVPMSAEMRAWREQTGRLAAYLSREAETVTRVFCGLGQRLK